MGFLKNSRLLSFAAVVVALFSPQLALAQTYSECNPLYQSCAPNPALGRAITADLTAGPSGEFAGAGNGISYGSDGAQLTVSGPGDNPTLLSKWYMMFGRLDVVMQGAPGVGMVSSAILQSDDLDEIDWELLGADSSTVQTNYFGKGVTGDFDRAEFVSAPTSQSALNTYSIVWNADQITWAINGAVVRTVTAAEAGGQYPQTPMQVRIGSWAGGDSSNNQGTIDWSGGPIDYSGGPYTMYVQSITAVDYSTGTSYQYVGTSGSWQSIKANGGAVNPSGQGVDTGPVAAPPQAPPGDHPSVYPWVPKPSTVGTGVYASITSASTSSYADLFPSSSVSLAPPSSYSGSPQPPASYGGGSSGGKPPTYPSMVTSKVYPTGPQTSGVAQPTGVVPKPPSPEPTPTSISPPVPTYPGAAPGRAVGTAAVTALSAFTALLLFFA